MQFLVEMQACKSINIQRKLKSGKGSCRNWSEAAPGANFGRYVVMVTWVPKPILQIDMDALRMSIRVVYAANISNFVVFEISEAVPGTCFGELLHCIRLLLSPCITASTSLLSEFLANASFNMYMCVQNFVEEIGQRRFQEAILGGQKRVCPNLYCSHI